MERLFAILLLACFHLCSLNGDETSSTICDNGSYKIEQDMEKVSCSADEITITEYMKPAGSSYCISEDHDHDAHAVCMDEDIKYFSQPPLIGNYRPMAPQYGQYHYLPPQRWLHALKYGGVAFLYHPCAPLDQVMELKQLAVKCLKKHIITPYPHLDTDTPFALVSWGCAYKMKWIDSATCEAWLTRHALSTVEHMINQDGHYSYDIIESSYNTSTLQDKEVCPDHAPSEGPPTVLLPVQDDDTDTDDYVPSTEDAEDEHATNNNSLVSESPAANRTECPFFMRATTDPSSNTSSCTNIHYNINIHGHNVPLAALLGVFMFVSLGLCCLVLCVFCSKHSHKKLRNPSKRYKNMNYFYNPDHPVPISIPEVGLPKTMPSEREKLLLQESDEDEL